MTNTTNTETEIMRISKEEKLENRIVGTALVIMIALAIATCVYGLTVTEMWPWQL